MNERAARDVSLMQAIETADRKREILSDDDRKYASRSAKELAQWQASDRHTEASSEHFLQHRAEQILKRIGERHPAFATVLKRRDGFRMLMIFLPFLSLLAGAGLDRLGDPGRVDLLSAPLLLIIGWNLLVYVVMLVHRFFPVSKSNWSLAALLRRFGSGPAGLPRKLAPALSAALLAFAAEWAHLSARLTSARLARTIHLSAALFALGAMLSLYARGLLTQYVAGWESTFLNASQVQMILSTLFAPAVAVFPLQEFSIADIEALRFGRTPNQLGGARWVHLYAATLFLLVVLPRLLFAAVAHWQARRLERNFPLDLQQPYFQQLGAGFGASPGTLRVLPYSFTVDEARDLGLARLATLLLGEQARLMLRPSIAYGEEPPQALDTSQLKDDPATLTAVLFNLAATPEKENHGALLDYLVRTLPHGIAVLIDESSYLERIGNQESSKDRVAERIALWQEFCQFHKAPATIVNLLDPQARPLDIESGLRLSAKP